MNIRAIFTDIDGTLLDSSRQLSPRTIEVVKKAGKKIPFILASSRMPSAMRHLQAELDLPEHPLICYNGGFVIQYTSGNPVPEVFDSVFIPAEICASILSLAIDTTVHVSLYYEDEWYAPALDQWTNREQTITKTHAMIANLSAIIDTWQKRKIGAHKIMCMGPAEEIGILEKRLRQKHGEHIHVYCSRSTYLELAPKTISKATAMKLIAARYNIPVSGIMAFGDNYNDIEMIGAAGMGIAVANAREEAKAVAKEITGKSVEDGVALAIEKYCFSEATR
jgi:Cof subfamily protein (haloacid dehalogenase superfamily)